MSFKTRLMAPLIPLLNQCGFRAKFLVIATILLMPFVVVSYQLLQRIQYDIAFTQHERLGVTYLAPLRQLTDHLAQHRGMTAAILNGNTSFSANRRSIKVTIETLFAQLNTLTTNGLSEATRATLTDMQAQWSTVQALHEPDAAFAAHSALIEQSHLLLRQVAEQTGLILDPTPASYYLMNLSLFEIPQLVELMGQARGVGAGLISAGDQQPLQQEKLHFLARQIRYFHNEIEHQKTTLFNQAEQLKTALDPRFQHAAEQVTALQHAIMLLLDNTRLHTLDAGDYFQQASQAINAVYTLHDTLVPTLDQELANRITALYQERLLTASAIVAALLLMLLVFNSLYQAIREQVNDLSRATTALAEGDLNQDVNLTSNDEFQLIAKQLNYVIQELSQSIHSIRRSCGGLESLGQETYDNTYAALGQVEIQSAEITQAATAMQEMAASVDDISRATQSAAEDATSSMQAATQGQQIVDIVVHTVQRLRREVSQAEETITRLAKDTHDITKIVDTINGIAEQTNLLALNAAIESARAGDHGRGFAVVANEVRVLANHTQSATSEIQAMIKRLQDGAERSVATMQSSARQAGECEQQVLEAHKALDNIVHHVGRIHAVNIQIATATEEQSAVADDITRNITTVSSSADRTAHLSQVAFESAAKLTTLGGEINALVERFHLEEAIAQTRIAAQPKLLQWQPDLDVGVSELNRQHQRLIDIANELYRLSVQGNSEYAMRRVMDSLINYTATHFRYEELLMERYGYPDLAEHKKKHARLVESVLALKRRIDNGEQIMEELMNFIRDWLQKHIKGTDRDYTAYLNERGVH